LATEETTIKNLSPFIFRPRTREELGDLAEIYLGNFLENEVEDELTFNGFHYILVKTTSVETLLEAIAEDLAEPEREE
jgi:hypothetical protein